MPLTPTTETLTYEGIAALATEFLHRGKPTNQTFGPNSGLGTVLKFAETVNMTGGTEYHEVILVERDEAEFSYKDMDTVASTWPNLETRAYLETKEMAVPFGYSFRERDLLNGPQAIANALATKAANARRQHAHELNLDLYGVGTANDSKVIVGLPQWVDSDPTTDTVAGVNRANVTAWANIAVDNDNTVADLLSNMRSATQQATWDNGGPRIVLCNRAFERALMGRALFVGPTVYRQDLGTATTREPRIGVTLEIGARYLQYAGMPVVADPFWVQWGTATGPGQCVLLTPSTWKKVLPLKNADEPTSNEELDSSAGMFEIVYRPPGRQMGENWYLRSHWTLFCSVPRENATVFNVGADSAI